MGFFKVEVSFINLISLDFFTKTYVSNVNIACLVCECMAYFTSAIKDILGIYIHLISDEYIRSYVKNALTLPSFIMAVYGG